MNSAMISVLHKGLGNLIRRYEEEPGCVRLLATAKMHDNTSTAI